MSYDEYSCDCITPSDILTILKNTIEDATEIRDEIQEYKKMTNKKLNDKNVTELIFDETVERYVNDILELKLTNKIKNIKDLKSLTIYRKYKVINLNKICENYKLETLNIFYCNLKSLPKCISKLINITELDLHGNKLKSIPKCVFSLINLKTMNVSNNKINNINNISKLINLEFLDISSNFITKIPISIDKLTNLKVLLCGYNRIRYLPDTLNNLINLERIFLTGNELVRFDQNFNKLTGLKCCQFENNKYKIELPRNMHVMLNLQKLYFDDTFILTLNTFNDIYKIKYRNILINSKFDFNHVHNCFYRRNIIVVFSIYISLCYI